jgi:catechol 2,3-dioxygenase-like lactoylglutathione lyase family enzyme
MAIIEGGRATHTTLECRAVAPSLRFYRDVMGLRVHQPMPGVGHLMDTKGHYAAILQKTRPGPQPFLNFYARPVASAADVDAIHARIVAVRDEHQITEITAPALEDPRKFAVASYGFYLTDLDGNRWRIEDNRGPFGQADLAVPANTDVPGSIVPAGPISYVMLESRDLAVTTRCYRDLLGLTVDIDPIAPHACRVRDRFDIVRAIVVDVGDRVVPQAIVNHHGITLDLASELGGIERIDAIRARIHALAGEFGLIKVYSPTHQHGSYAFYLQDADTNCWEIETWDRGISFVRAGIEATGIAGAGP